MPDAEATTIRGHQALVAHWFDEHAGAIGNYAARRVGATLARDVVADTFRVAFEQHDRFDPAVGEVRGWLFGIAPSLTALRGRSPPSHCSMPSTSGRQRLRAARTSSSPGPIRTGSDRPHRVQADTRVDSDDDIGSPQLAVVAASADTAVVITPDRLVGDRTVVLVGTLRSHH